MNIGSGDCGEFTFLDIIGLMSFFIALQNLDMNITQEDMQNVEHKMDNKLQDLLGEVHRHLEEQDDKINKILEALDNGSKRDI